MKSTPSPSATPSAVSVRRFRDRLRERGLVKKEVWILPEHAAALSEMEVRMREATPGAGQEPVLEARPDPWTAQTLARALAQTAAVLAGHMTVEFMEGAEPTLRLTMHEHGELPVLLAIGGEQILVEVYLWPASAVRDAQAFNAAALQTHKYLPLATFALSTIGEEAGYTLFGALDTRSSLDSVLLEIQAIADNAIAAVDLYAEHLLEDTRS